MVNKDFRARIMNLEKVVTINGDAVQNTDLGFTLNVVADTASQYSVELNLTGSNVPGASISWDVRGFPYSYEFVSTNFEAAELMAAIQTSIEDHYTDENAADFTLSHASNSVTILQTLPHVDSHFVGQGVSRWNFFVTQTNYTSGGLSAYQVDMNTRWAMPSLVGASYVVNSPDDPSQVFAAYQFGFKLYKQTSPGNAVEIDTHLIHSQQYANSEMKLIESQVEWADYTLDKGRYYLTFQNNAERYYLGYLEYQGNRKS